MNCRPSVSAMTASAKSVIAVLATASLLSIPWMEVAAAKSVTPNAVTPTIKSANSLTPQGRRRNRIVFRLLSTRGAPASREGGATRSASCLAPQKPLTALMPTTNVGHTAQAFPTVYVYLPATTAETAEFMLLDPSQNGKVIYQATMPVQKTGGIVGVALSEQEGASPLEIGKQYQWFFTVQCDLEDPSANTSVSGWIQRVPDDAELAANLQAAKPEDRPALYADKGLWFEALKALVELRRDRPSDPNLQVDWSDLLASVKLDTLAMEPLVPCCKPQPQ